MGNRVTNTLDKWGINPRKLSLKKSKRKTQPPAPPHQTLDPHIYDNVAPDPHYAIVNKKQKTPDSDGLHYAEIQVLQSEFTNNQRTAPPTTSSTEYATIDFLRGTNLKQSDEPADILIPPGELQGLMVKSQKKRRVSSHRGVLV